MSKLYSEPFTQTAHRLDGPGPCTRQNIAYMGQTHIVATYLNMMLRM